LEEELGRLVSVQPRSQQALMHEKHEELAPEHHGDDVRSGAAMLGQQVMGESDGFSRTETCPDEFPQALQVARVNLRGRSAAS